MPKIVEVSKMIIEGGKRAEGRGAIGKKEGLGHRKQGIMTPNAKATDFRGKQI